MNPTSYYKSGNLIKFNRYDNFYILSDKYGKYDVDSSKYGDVYWVSDNIYENKLDDPSFALNFDLIADTT